MKHSQSIAEIAKALAQFQIRVEDPTKNATNPHLKNRYADIQSILESVRVPLAACGLSFTQFQGYADGVVYMDSMLLHSSGEWLQGTASAPLVKQDAQSVGATATYLRRQSLSAMLGLAQIDDDAQSVAIKSTDKLCTFAQSDRLQRLLDKCPESTKSWMAETYGDASRVPKSEFDKIYNGIAAKLKAGEEASE